MPAAGAGAPPNIPAWADRLATPRLAPVVLVCWCALCFLPGLFSLPAVDRDESRFAQASRQIADAAAAGDLENTLVPRVQDRPRLNKPPLVYWLQAPMGRLFDRPGPGELPRIWPYRLPSALGATIAVLLTWLVGRRLTSPAAALLGAAMLAGSVMVLWDARQARSDQLLLATTTATMLALLAVWSRAAGAATAADARRAAGLIRPLAFWALLALGVLAKGPITPMIAGLAIVALGVTTRSWAHVRALRPGVGALVFLAVAAPWFVAVAAIVGPADYARLIFDETIGRASAPKESHWGPPGYHLVLLPVLLLPASIVTLGALIAAVRAAFGGGEGDKARSEKREANIQEEPASAGRGVRRGRLVRLWLRLRSAEPFPGRFPAATFCLAWTVPAWIVFELSATKLPHYTLPLYPPIAILTAHFLLHRPRSETDPGVVGWVIWLVLLAAVAIAVPIGGTVAASPVSRPWPEPFGFFLLGSLGIVVLGPRVVLIAALQRRPLAAQLAALPLAALAVAMLTRAILPSSADLWVSDRLAAQLTRGEETPIATVGYHEDSLVFLTRGRVERIGRAAAADWLAEHPTGRLAAPAPLARELLGADPALAAIGRVSGFNYSTGDPVELVVLSRAGGASVR